MRIAIGCDHRGLGLKQAITNFLKEMGLEYQDFGCYDASPVDYPDIAGEVGKAVARGEFDRGILICSTGIGMSIAANKVPGIRAALCHNSFTVSCARKHNDANLLCLGADVVALNLAREIVKIYLSTDFEGGRHARRVEKLRAIEVDKPR